MSSWWQCFLSEVTTLHSGSLGSGVDEERSKLRVGMWTAGHMSIDTLNAYCGHRLERCPCLSQGRFCIPLRTFEFGALGSHSPSWVVWLQVLSASLFLDEPRWLLGYSPGSSELSWATCVAAGRLNASVAPPIFASTWEQARWPAKFKHINKRRKRKQLWCP